MDDKIVEALVKQLDEIIARYLKLRARCQYDDLSDSESSELSQFVTTAQAAIERIGGKNSVYTRRVKAIFDLYTADHPYNAVVLYGIVEALKADLSAGYLQTIGELIHADVFDDFLEMADHLWNEGYKDAAAVIAGSTLEAHLRQLCRKHGVDAEVKTAKGDVVPKKADRLNADVAKEEVYSKLDQKDVTAWLGLRNKAAHGEYDEYTSTKVAVMVAGIREFMKRVPA